MTEYVTVWVDDLPDLKRGEEIVRCRDCACAVVTHPLNPITGVPAGIEYWRCEHFWNADELCEVEPDGFCAWGARNDDSAPKNDVSDTEVDANDADAASVSFSSVTETGNADSREKLEEDCEKLIRSIQRRIFSGRDAGALRYQLKELLDRQAAITEREHPGLTVSEDESLINWRGENYLLQSRVLNAERERDEFSLKLKHEMELNRDNRNALDLERIADLQQQADDLRGEWHRVCAERANLAHDLGECMADRDELREKLSTAIAHARCITRLIELG